MSIKCFQIHSLVLGLTICNGSNLYEMDCSVNSSAHLLPASPTECHLGYFFTVTEIRKSPPWCSGSIKSSYREDQFTKKNSAHILCLYLENKSLWHLKVLLTFCVPNNFLFLIMCKGWDKPSGLLSIRAEAFPFYKTMVRDLTKGEEERDRDRKIEIEFLH